MSRLEELVRSFTDVRLLVIGDPMLDRYISGPSTRLSPEAAVPVIAVERTDEYPGGAANAAANGAVLGARVTMAGLIGDDRAGDALRRLLAQAGVSQPEAGTVAGRITLSNTRIVAGTTPLARIDEGTTSPPEEPDMERLKAAIKHAWAACDAVIISDYGYGSVPPEIRLLIERLQQASPRVLAVDARDLRTYRPAAPTVVKPNHYEATALIARSGGPGGFPGDIAEYAAPLFECTGAAIVALSLGRAGAAVFERDGSVHRTSARPRNQLQAAGAGDCYLTAFALTLASGGSCQDSAEIAAAAAQVSVDGEGTRTCGQAELLAKLGPQPSLATWEQLEERLARARARGQRVVFTNGVFDILHPGHIAYLRAARELGDLLIVGLNSDASTIRLRVRSVR